MTSDVLARMCVNCGQPYIILVPEFLRLPQAATIIGDAMDRHQQQCPNTCSHCARRMPSVGYHRDVCSTRCVNEARKQRRRADAEDIIHLIACGLSGDEALSRVGWSREAASLWARRYHRPDLLAALRTEEMAA